MIFILLGVVFLTAGLLFLFWPGAVAKLEAWGEKVIFSDQGMLKHHTATGILFLLAGAALFVFAYWTKQWHLSQFFAKILF